MATSRSALAALISAHPTQVPIVAHVTFLEDGRTIGGDSPERVGEVLGELGVVAIAHKIPAMTHPDTPAILILSAILTDGEDEGSKLKIRDAIEAAQRADAIVYVLLCADRGGYYSMGMSYSGEGEMKKLTEATGGRVINVGNKFDKLKEAFDQIAAELRSQYSLGYTSANTVLDGGYRKLEIKSKEGYKIQTRAGYYATKRDQQQ